MKQENDDKFDIQDILRLEHILRWTVVPTTVRQSVAAHTFNVVFIARAIAKRAGVSDDRIIKMALEHDLDEIITSDIPTPGKKSIEKLYNFKFTSSGKNLKDASEDEKLILKVSDLMEASVFIAQYGVGRYAEFTADHLDDRLNQLFFTLPAHIKDASFNVLVDIMGKNYNYE